jgi:predicted O-linked N-acetylglucosamine transferase (SPINDLY family)/glycosyltransferase involved in cell wall biosynthesis
MTESIFLAAQRAHQGGDLVRAAELYQQVLQSNARHADAHHMLAIVFSQQGQHDRAIPSFQQAVALAPGNPAFQNNLGEAYRRADQPDQAIVSFRQALTVAPDFAAAHFNLANLLKIGGEIEQALIHYQEAIRLQPGYVQALNNLGNTYLGIGRLDEARRTYLRILEHDPNHAQALHNLGTTMRQAGMPHEAIQYFERLLPLQPKLVTIQSSLGELYRDLGQIGAAIHYFGQAAQLEPQNGDWRFHLGLLTMSQGETDAAIRHYREAARLQPGSAEVRNNLGIAVQALGEHARAADHFAAAIELNPDLSNIHRNLGLANKLQGKMQAAEAAYRSAVQLEPDDSLLQLESETVPPYISESNAAIDAYRTGLSQTLDRYAAQPINIDLNQLHIGESCPPYVLVYQGRDEREIKEKWAAIFADRLPEAEPKPSGGKPHIGFVVTDTHAGVFIRSLKGILERLSGEQFKLTIVCNRASVAKFVRQSVDNPALEYLVFPSRLDQAAFTLFQAKFDLLYYWEIGTDASNYFLAFFRPAPVQMTSWGWQVTTGIPQMDHYVSSTWIEPPHAQAHYSEKLILLDTLLSHYTPPPAPPELGHAHFGLSADQNIYFCAQSLLKVHPDFDPLMAEILRQDPKGQIVLVGHEASHPAQLLKTRLQAAMPDVMDRLRILPRLPEEEFLALLRLADVSLDTRHYGGVNTTYQSLYLETPVITWPGEFQRGRFSAGAYQKIGLTEPIADSAEQYIELAVRFASDGAEAERLATDIRQAAPALYQDERAASELADYFERAVAAVSSGAGSSPPLQAETPPGAPSLLRREEPQRVLFIDASTGDYAPDTPYQRPLGGSQSALCYLAEQLAENGKDVFLLNRITRPRIVKGAVCLELPNDPAKIAKKVRWLGADTVISLNGALPPALAELRDQARLILWTQHAHDQPGVEDLAQPAFRDFWNHFVFVSEWQRNHYLSKFGIRSELSTVMRNAISPPFQVLPAYSAEVRRDPPTLVYTSTPFRGLDVLLDVFPQIRSAVPAARLKIFSSMKVYQRDDEDAIYHELYDRAQKMEGVEYIGAIPQRDLAAELAQATLLAYPNTYPETSCIAVMEAMAAGLHVVTSELGALPETSAGFADLISWDVGPEAYREQFAAAVIDRLKESSASASDRLSKQVRHAQSVYSWPARAAEWLEWLAAG